MCVVAGDAACTVCQYLKLLYVAALLNGELAVQSFAQEHGLARMFIEGQDHYGTMNVLFSFKQAF